MLLNSDVSCSSVHASDMTFVLPKLSFIGAGASFFACLTASLGGVDSALEGRRTLFLGGMVNKLYASGYQKVSHKVCEDSHSIAKSIVNNRSVEE